MLDLTRLRPIVVVVAALLAGLAAINLGLAAILGRPGHWFSDEHDHYDWYFVEKAGGRFSGVQAERKGATREPLGVFLGMSTVTYAIDPAQVERADGLPYRWLLVNGFGGGVPKVGPFVELLSHSGLGPKVVVLGIDPIMLVARRPRDEAEPPAGAAAVARALAAGRPRVALGGLKGLAESGAWAYQNRYYVKQVARRSMMQWRTRLLESAGLGVDAAFPPAADPWTPMLPEHPDYDDPPYLDNQMMHWTAQRCFDPGSYRADSPDARELAAMITGLRAAGAEVVIVAMPLRSSLRSRLPAEARRHIGDVLARAFGADAPPYLDLTDALPDEGFSNHNHANPKGRAAFSAILARRLHEVLAPGPAAGRPPARP